MQVRTTKLRHMRSKYSIIRQKTSWIHTTYTPSVYSLYILGRKHRKINSWTTSFIRCHLFLLQRKRCRIFSDGVHHITLDEREPFQNSSLSALASSAPPPFEDGAKPSRGGPVVRGGPILPAGRGSSARDQWLGSAWRSWEVFYTWRISFTCGREPRFP